MADEIDNEEDQTQDDQTQDQTTDEGAAEEPENKLAAEVDPSVDSGDQVNTNSQAYQDSFQPGGDRASGSPTLMSGRGPGTENMDTSPAGNLQLADGSDTGVAVDSSVQYDALNPTGEASMDFKSGNFGELMSMPQKLAQKSETITRTVVPLIGAALIELLGNSAAFTCDTFESSFNMNGDEPTFTVTTKYNVELWIGNDIAQEAIAQDSKYVLDRINVVPGVTYTKCEIDCNEGTLTVAFTC